MFVVSVLIDDMSDSMSDYMSDTADCIETLFVFFCGKHCDNHLFWELYINGILI